MSTKNNIMLISDNIDLAIKIAKDLWKYNTNYCIISTDNGYDYKIKHFISEENDRNIIVTNPDWIFQKKVNSYINYCKNYNIVPFFISEKNNLDKTHLLYTNLEEIYPDSTEYIYCYKDEETYKMELSILKSYLW